MRGTQTTSTLFNSIDKHFKESNAQVLLWQTQATPSSGSLLQQLTFFCWSGCMLVCSMLCIYLRYCATRACTVDTLYMYPMHPKACMEGAVASSTFSPQSRLLSNGASSAAQDVGTRNCTVMYMYDVHLTVRI